MLQTFIDHRPCSKAEFALTSFKLACQESTLLDVRMNINRLIYDRQLIDFYFPDIELDGIYKRQYSDPLSDDIVFIYGTKNIENYKPIEKVYDFVWDKVKYYIFIDRFTGEIEDDHLRSLRDFLQSFMAKSSMIDSNIHSIAIMMLFPFMDIVEKLSKRLDSKNVEPFGNMYRAIVNNGMKLDDIVINKELSSYADEIFYSLYNN